MNVTPMFQSNIDEIYVQPNVYYTQSLNALTGDIHIQVIGKERLCTCT